MKKALLLCMITTSIFIPSCQSDNPVLVGSKHTADNIVLAKLLIYLAREAGIPVQDETPYGNTFDCQEAIRRGEIDLYPEYSGTGLSMMGSPPIYDADKAFEKAKELFSQHSIKCLPRLGVNNGYVLVMRADRAAASKVEKVSDLSQGFEKLRFGLGKEFMTRSVDGMAALCRRYGIHRFEVVIESSSKEKLYYALLNNKVDVVVGFATDGHIEKFDFTVLKDDLAFFPVYEAVPIVRESVLKRYPDLEEVSRKLREVLDEESLQHLNKEVELNGASPDVVSQRFLKEKGLLSKERGKIRQALFVVSPPLSRDESLSRLRGIALNAVRYANPGRLIKLRPSHYPVKNLREGYSFIAVLGAESFFQVSSKTSLPRRREGIEAVAALGSRMLHLLTLKAKDQRKSKGNLLYEVETLGVGVEHGSSHQTAKFVLQAYSLDNEIEPVFGSDEELLKKLEERELDALLKMAEVGDPSIAMLMEEKDLELHPLPDWSVEGRAFRYPFLRRSRIPAGVYEGLDRAVETISSQVVLAAASKTVQTLGDGGPSSALRSAPKALPKAIKKKLIQSIAKEEMIDPALPGKDYGVESLHRERRSVTPPPGVPLLCALVIGLLTLFSYYILKA